MISTSKIRKINAIKKKWIENGKRAEFLGSNPHSKGDLFSRSLNDFLEIMVAIIIIIIIIKVKIKIIVKINIIINTNL